jgi:predicted nicotinamide N-methyase
MAMSSDNLHIHAGKVFENRGARPAVDELSIPIGDLRVIMRAPRHRNECSERISFWWGITSAAVALSQHLAAMGNLTGYRAIELGCGLGLTGLTAGMLGARVSLTDSVPEAIEFARQNARLNGLDEERACCELLDWERPGDLPPFSLILGSEILYDYFFHGSLISLFRCILAPGGTILLADRPRLAISRFIGRMRGADFSCREIRTRVNLHPFPPQEISIFALATARQR